MNAIQQQCYEAVLNRIAVSESIEQPLQQELRNWIDNGQTEEGAQVILSSDEFHTAVYPTSKTRYRQIPQGHCRAALLQHMFSLAIKEQNAGAIPLPTAGYPLWKRVCWIYVPKGIGAILCNKAVRTVAVISAFVLAIIFGYKTYAALGEWIVAKAVPFIINNAPLALIHLFNQAMAAFEFVMHNPFTTVVGLWVGRTIVLHALPEIPCLSDVARAIDLNQIFWGIVLAPWQLLNFVFWESVGFGVFVYQGMVETGAFFNDLGDQAEAESQSCIKETAWPLWQQACNTQLQLQAQLA